MTLYRIETEKRIKIVRDEFLEEEMSWDANNSGDSDKHPWVETTLSDGTTYAGADLKQYLNEGESSYYNSLSGIAKSQIGDALWHTGAVSDVTASNVYADERSDKKGTSTSVIYTTTWVGKVGLIYPSDYGYAGTQ